MKNLTRIFRLLDFSNPRHFLYVCFLALCIGGLISVWLGADTNWDLMNYHLYNPHAFFHQKIEIDLAPAGMQSYFNPTIDIPYYWLTQYFPAPAVGFIMGAFHSLSFIFLALIAREMLPHSQDDNKISFSLLLAVFGSVTGNFLAQFGGTMGDATTAVLLLGALFCVIKNIQSDAKKNLQLLWFLFAGVVAGSATGLKLTNAVYAVALCASFFILPTSWITRFKWAFIFGLGVLGGLVGFSGHWFVTLWEHFSNPLFPQFGNIFPSSLGGSTGIVDTHWYPENLWEYLLWPIVISLKPLRVGEINQLQLIWAVVYILLLVWLVRLLFFKKSLALIENGLSPQAKYLIACVVIGFIVWMKVFSIQRYLIVIEMCAPIVIYLVLTQLLDSKRAKKMAIKTLWSCSFFVIIISHKTWGHAPWAEKMFHADIPSIENPKTTTVLVVSSNKPYAWVTTLFPATIAFAQVGGDFAFNHKHYLERMHQINQRRKGDIFVIFKKEVPTAVLQRLEKINRFGNAYNIFNNAKYCHALQSLLKKTKASIQIDFKNEDPNSFHCEAVLLDPFVMNAETIDVQYKKEVAVKLQEAGYTLNQESCSEFTAYIGSKAFPLFWCRVEDTDVLFSNR